MTSSNGHAIADNNGTVDNDVATPTQAVKVAVHIRPLIVNERLQGCKDCVTIVGGEPQVQIGNCCFTFDHVYGSTATPSGRIFEECVTPLVDGLFHGYNATVLAYGQTGSGKTYTMGTGFTAGGSTYGIIPQVMELIYKRMESSSKKVEYQVRVSFIEILNEEVHDLLDSSIPTTTRPDMYVGLNARPTTPSKNSIQIRETTGGEITLSGVTEIEVDSLRQMATLLEQGSFSRATASTNMNSTSSRSHAILTITLHQHWKLDVLAGNGTALVLDNFHDDYLCAKLHLVDLAGSERVKRTGADGMRFKEGVHINKGLLALGNVISALGDEKKRKDGGHIPYRDSKLTRLLQDSLGGNSRTVMIACISPADSNAEESLNTLKYANRARNIQNKPIVNRDPMVAEMQRMRQQLELLQAELLCFRAGGGAIEDTHMLKQKIAWLEANNSGLRQELQQARDGLQFCAQRVLDALIERDDLRHKIDLLRSGKSWEEVNGIDAYQACYLNDKSVELLHAYTTKIQELESSIHHIENAKSQSLAPMSPSPFIRCVSGSIVNNGDYLELHEVHRMMSSTPEEDETAAKELEHTRLQVSMDKELQELNERLEQKEAEMTMIVTLDSEVLKEQFEKKLMELEEEKKTLQMERDILLLEIENLSCVSDEQAQKMQEDYAEKLKNLESQLAELKQKQDNQAQFFKQKLHNDDAEKHLQEEIQRIKSQKVQLQHRIKQESEYFRYWKAAREKELLQLRKEGRKNEHEMLKLQALNQRQKMVLQRKTEEAALATRRLKDILEARKSSARENASTGPNAANGSPKHMNQKLLQQFVDQELEVAIHVHEVRSNYEKQAELRASLARELEKLRQEEDIQLDLKETNGHVDCTSPSTNRVTNSDARQARAELLKTMLDTSSNALVAMASELSEAEERERVCTGPGRWQQLRTMGDAKSLLHYVFSIAVDARCQLWDSNRENKDLKENIGKLKELLKQSEAHRREVHRQHHLTEHTIAKAIKTSTQVGLEMSKSRGMEEVSMSLLHSRGLDPQELCPAYSQSDMFSISSRGSQYGFKKAISRGARVKQNHPQVGKLLRWKRSHERWLLQFKWRWQKPWRLSEWIRHGDESLTRPRPLRLSNATEFQ